NDGPPPMDGVRRGALEGLDGDRERAVLRCDVHAHRDRALTTGDASDELEGITTPAPIGQQERGFRQIPTKRERRDEALLQHDSLQYAQIRTRLCTADPRVWRA